MLKESIRKQVIKKTDNMLINNTLTVFSLVAIIKYSHF